MSPWTSNLLGRAPANRVEGVFDALYGFMGQAFFSSGHARGPEGWEARSSSVGRGPGCAQVADSGIGHTMSEGIPQTFESMDIDKLIAAAQSFEALTETQQAAGSMVLDWPTAAQELHSEQASLGQQRTAELVAKESTPTLGQQPTRHCKSRQVRRQPLARQESVMPQKRRLQEQPLEGRHRDKRRHRERRSPQAPVCGEKRSRSAEADKNHSKAARSDAKTWPCSQHGQASKPAPQTGFTMGLQPRKAMTSLRRMKKGGFSILKEAAGQPHSPHAVSNDQHEARLPQFTWGCCNRRPRNARRPAACMKAASPAAATAAVAAVTGSSQHAPADSATPATAAPDEPPQAPVPALDTATAPDEELQVLVDAFCTATEPSEAADMSAIFGCIGPEPQAPATRPLYNVGPAATPAAASSPAEVIGAPKSDTWPAPKVLALQKPEWRLANPDAARIFTRLKVKDLTQSLKKIGSSNEASLTPPPLFWRGQSSLRFETQTGDNPAISLAARISADFKLTYLQHHGGTAPEPSHQDYPSFAQACKGCHGYSMTELLLRSARYQQSVQQGLVKPGACCTV